MHNQSPDPASVANPTISHEETIRSSVEALALSISEELKQQAESEQDIVTLADNIQQVQQLAPVDQADLLQQLSGSIRLRLLHCLPELQPEVLIELDATLREELIKDLDDQQLVKLGKRLQSDEIVNILAVFADQELVEKFINVLGKRKSKIVKQCLTWPAFTAGRLMRHNYIGLHQDSTVGQAIDLLRSMPKTAKANDFYTVILVDDDNQPQGSVKISRLLSEKRAAKLLQIRQKQNIVIAADTDQEDMMNLFRRYNLVESPVVNGQNQLVGTISVDEIFDVIEEEQEDDLLHLSGIVTDDFYQDIISTIKSRFVWLLVNLLTAILASILIGLFAEQIAAVIALAILLPVVASMGGNAGTQTLAIAIRALATQQLTGANNRQVLIKEIAVNLSNGLLLGLVVALVTWFWFGSPMLAMVICIAMIINLVTAGAFGLLIPVMLTRLNFDPAIGSSVILTTFTDCVGFFAFLGIATLLL